MKLGLGRPKNLELYRISQSNTMKTDVEVWAAVEEADFEGMYEVSNLGRVRKTKTGKIMKQYNNGYGYGYLKVDFMNNGKRVKLYVHRLVAKAFVPNDDPTTKTLCNHLDENPLNNRADNLEWTTFKGNLNYGTAKERKEITRAMDSELKAKREKLMREIGALTLRKVNYNEYVDSKIEAITKEIKKLENKC